MHRLKLKHLKTCGLLFIFSLLVSGAFAGILIWIVSSLRSTPVENYDMYFLVQTDYEQMINHSGYLLINPKQMIAQSAYQRQLIEQILLRLIPVFILFCLVLFLCTLGLWLLLKSRREKRTLQIAQQMQEAIFSAVHNDEPALEAAYGMIRQSFEDQLEDYKRLHSYLSHDQKNVLAVLRTTLELSGQKESLSGIDYLTASIDDLLTLSENIGSTSFSEVDLSLVCAEICDRYRAAEIPIVYEFDDLEDTVIQAKQRWIYRAAANLLDNAVKYGEGNPVYVSVRAKNGSVILCVKDQGIGIPLEKQEQIFSNRYRVNELNKDGYGIGLSLVSHVCNLCGGFVAVDSRPGKGSSFYLSFPQSPSRG